MATKKVKQTGRYGSRYGVGIRKRLLKVEPLQRKKQTCPKCGFKKVERISTGIFHCPKCNLEMAGGAYLPETDSGKIIRKMVEQKSFLKKAAELLATREDHEEQTEDKEEKKSTKVKKKKVKKKESKETHKIQEQTEDKEEIVIENNED